jgi:PAS domain S-box-containing protein
MHTFTFPPDVAGRMPILGYGVAVSSVAAALVCTVQMEAHWHASAPVATLLMAVILTTRVGGLRPALLATVLSLLGFAYFVLLAGSGSVPADSIQLVRLLALAVVACYVVWVTATERSADESLRRAHDELRRNNEALRLENMERRRNEELLRASETKFRAVADSVPAAILIYREGNICYANPAASAITGYSTAELCDLGVLQVVAPGLRDFLSGRGLESQSGESASPHRELQIKTKGGHERWLDFTGAVFDFGGQPAVVGIACDITEHKRAEDSLRTSQQLLEQVLATLPVAVAVMNEAGNIVLCNAASKRIWGNYQVVSGSERWARTRGYWHDTGRQLAASDWASVRALTAGQTSLDELIDIDTYDGRRKTILNSAAPIRNADRQIVGAVVVNEDVTERVRAERALQASATRLQHLSRRLLEVQEEERRHLSRELHDEFGQLLATVMLQLRMVSSTVAKETRASIEESIALLQRAAEELRNLVLELRPTMLESAGLPVTLRWLADQHQQRTGIVTEVFGEVDEVPADLAIACFRVTQEALTNVVRHSRARHVWIELHRRAGRLELLIRDDGVGFDVGTVLERAAARGSVGLLGMKERVQILGGDLHVESAPGRGTSIHVSVPVTSPATVAAEAANA